STIAPSKTNRVEVAMICRNHVDVSEGVRRCSRCGATFCRDCLVDIGGSPYRATCKTEKLIDVRSGVPPGILELAPISRRFWAVLLDSVILYIVAFTVGTVMGLAIRAGASPALGCVNILVGLLINVSYEAILVAARGQTVGKMALK